MDTPNYFGVDYKDLQFIRIIKGFDGSIVNNKSELELKLAEPASEKNLRNTTHGTLNAIVQDHHMGKFSDSRYAIVAPFLEMAKNNELLSLNPSDTYFWNNDEKVKIANATIFAPTGETLPNNLEQLNIVRYEPSDLDNYNNLSQAIYDYMDKEHYPMLSIDKHGWVLDKSFNQYAPEAEQARHFAEAIKYPIAFGLHDGSVYSQLEDVCLKNYKTDLQLKDINSKEEFEKTNKERLTETLGKTFHEEVESSLVIAKELIQELPEHHQKFYQDKLLPKLKKTQETIIQGVNAWYASEVENTIGKEPLNRPMATPVATPPPAPSYKTLGRQIDPEPLSVNAKIFAVVDNFTGKGQDQNVITKADINAIQSFYNQINKRLLELGISKGVLELAIDKNLHLHYQSLEGKDKQSFQKAYEKMANDAQCQRALTNVVNISQNLSFDISDNIRDYTKKLANEFQYRDFKNHEADAIAWEKAKNAFYIKALSDHNLSKDVAQNLMFHSIAIPLFATSEKKAWWDLIKKDSPLETADFTRVTEHGKLLDKNADDLSKYLTSELNQPSLAEKNEKAAKERDQQLKRDLENKQRNEELQSRIKQDQDELQKRTDAANERERLKQIELEQEQLRMQQNQNNAQHEQKGDGVKKVITAVAIVGFMQQYNKTGENDLNSALLSERDKLEQHRSLVSANLIAFKKAVERAGLDTNDIFFEKKENGELPKVSYGLKAIIDSSPAVKLTLNNLENSLAHYSESTLQHSLNVNKVVDHLNDRLTIADVRNIESNLNEYKGIHNEFTQNLKNSEGELKKHIAFIDSVHGAKTETLHSTAKLIKTTNEKTMIYAEPEYIKQYVFKKDSLSKNSLNHNHNQF